MKTITTAFCTLLLFLLVQNLTAQNSVSGMVTDANSDPLIGATILVQGTGEGTITDETGHYELANLADDAVLLFSYVGMAESIASLDGRSTIDI